MEKFDAKEDAGPKPVLELKNTCFLGTSVESGTATGVIVETGFRTYLGGMAQAIVGQKVADEFRQGRGAVHLADDPLHAGHGPAGVPHQRADEAQLDGGLLLRAGRGRGPHAGNAADDRLGVPVPRRHHHVAQEGDREAAELDSEPRRHGRALHRQDRDPHAGPGDPGAALRRGPPRGRGGPDAGLPQQPLPDGAQERLGSRDPPVPGDSREALGARLQEGRRDPLRFLPEADVGRRRDAGGNPPLDLQGRHGGRVPALQLVRAGGESLSDRPAA